MNRVPICSQYQKSKLISPVNDAFPVQKFKREQDLGGVEPRPVHVEPSGLLDVEHEVAAVQVLHHEEEVRLKGGGSIEFGGLKGHQKSGTQVSRFLQAR